MLEYFLKKVKFTGAKGEAFTVWDSVHKMEIFSNGSREGLPSVGIQKYFVGFEIYRFDLPTSSLA
jgi:hypothetical protein